MEARRSNPKIGPPTIVVIGKRGTGKCHGKGVGIRMSDLSVKRVEDVSVGDKVFGGDGSAKKVREIHRGQGEIFRVRQSVGDSYTVNKDHILVLRDIHFEYDVEISVMDYSILPPKDKRRLRGIKKSIFCPEFCADADPHPEYLDDDTIESFAKRCARGYHVCGIPDRLILGPLENREKFLKIYHREGGNTHASPSVIEGVDILKEVSCYYSGKCHPERLYDIEVSKIQNSGGYFGFDIGGDGRYFLEDYTLTHNSFLVADLLYYMRRIPSGVIMSGTQAGCDFFGKIFPSTFIYENYDPEKVEEIIKQQKRLTKNKKLKNVDKSTLLLLEDCMYDKKAMRSKNINALFYNGRHYKILFMLTMQYCMDIRPDLRSNIDYVFVLRENFINIRKKLYENFFGLLPTFESFNEVMDVVTDNHGCLVLDNTSKSNKIEDCLFWYKAKFPMRKFKVGSNELWKFHDEHYKSDSDDSETAPRSSSKGKITSVSVRKV